MLATGVSGAGTKIIQRHSGQGPTQTHSGVDSMCNFISGVTPLTTCNFAKKKEGGAAERSRRSVFLREVVEPRHNQMRGQQKKRIALIQGTINVQIMTKKYPKIKK